MAVALPLLKFAKKSQSTFPHSIMLAACLLLGLLQHNLVNYPSFINFIRGLWLLSLTGQTDHRKKPLLHTHFQHHFSHTLCCPRSKKSILVAASKSRIKYLRANFILSQPQYLWISNLLLVNCWSATCSHRSCCDISFCCWEILSQWAELLLFFISCSVLLFML